MSRMAQLIKQSTFCSIISVNVLSAVLAMSVGSLGVASLPLVIFVWVTDNVHKSLGKFDCQDDEMRSQHPHEISLTCLNI